VGDLQPDGSMVFLVDVPPNVEAVEIMQCVWRVPPGAQTMRIEISTTDLGEMRISARAGYGGDHT
jgi:hypothetical protein